MPTKRDVLVELTRDELLGAVDAAGIEVEDRRKKDALVERLAAARSVKLDAILPALSRDRLKALCRTFGLDDGGREKSALVERLVNGGAAVKDAPVATPSEKPAGRKKGNGAAEPVELAPGEKLTRERLERYLWGAADILRGQIDSSDYKNFIFGLLFLKRLSDRFEEECEVLRTEGADPDDPDEHEFFVPKPARWSEIQKAASNLGETLNKACSRLEEKNAPLEGVLAGIDYNDERKLGDARNRDNVLSRLVQHFSRLSLRNSDLSEPDMLGRAYEYLIEKFADDAWIHSPSRSVKARRLRVKHESPPDDARVTPHGIEASCLRG